MNKTCENYDFILSYILSKFEKSHLIYIGIGTASNKDFYNSIRENQQFPVFLENIKKKYSKLPIICILIDPNMESPLTHVRQFINNGSISEIWNINKKNDKIEIYENSLTNDILISIKDRISYFKRDNQLNYLANSENFLDITDFLESIIELNACNNGSTIFNDFSGKNFLEFNKYINNKYEQIQDRFVIGLDHIEYGGCFPDLESPIFQVRIFVNSDIKVFNPNKFIENPEAFYEELIKNKIDKCDIINSQLQCIYKGQIDFFLKYVMALYRQYYMIKNGDLVTYFRFSEYRDIIKIKYKNFEERETDINEMFFWFLDKLQKYLNINGEKKHEFLQLINLEQDYYKKGVIIKNYLMSCYDNIANRN